MKNTITTSAWLMVLFLLGANFSVSAGMQPEEQHVAPAAIQGIGQQLRLTARDGDIAGARRAIEAANRIGERAAIINMPNENGTTALMLAAWNRRIEMVQLLIAHNANINMRNQAGLTALSFAFNPVIRRILINAGGQE